jgi:hypothetical protein
MAIGVAEEQPRLVPVTLAAAGLAALAAGVAVGGSFAVAGPVSFLALSAAAFLEARLRILRWPNAIAFLLAIIWLVPIKLYTLPIKISFQLDPYRLIVLVLLVAFVLQWIVENRTPDAARHKGPLIAMALAGVASLAVNVSALHSNALQQQVVKSLGDYLAYLVLFVLIATKIRSREALDRTVLVIVGGGTLVALAAIYESRTHHNLFTHLNSFIPILKPVREAGESIRGGRLRVRASAQHPIALACALTMAVPLALYLAGRAKTAFRRIVGIVAALTLVAGATATVSRTGIAMLIGMIVVVLILRPRQTVRYWPVLIVAPVAIHFVAPGAISGIWHVISPPHKTVTTQLAGRAGASGSGRLADFGPGLRTWVHSPAFGFGPGTQLDYIAAQKGNVKRGTSLTAHAQLVFDDQYMSTLISYGMIGLLALIWFVWGAFFKLASSAVKIRGPDGDLLVATACAVAGFGVSLGTFDAFAFAQCSLLFFAIAAIGLSARRAALT